MTDHVAFTDQPAVRFGAATDVGMIRAGNEDAYVCEPMVFGVADGMGGHQAGEVASAIAARIVRERLSTGATNVGVVVAAVVEANAAIYQAAHASVDHHGMGTTLTALVVLRGGDDATPPRFALVNVGDSRTYLLRNGELHRATIDHSYVQELVNTGHITEEEARSHPRRNIVTRALGIEPTVRVDTWLVPMVKGDRFILCSDGLVDEVTDEDIGKSATSTEDPDALAQQLVAMANANGGRDNVTVVVVDVMQGVAPTPDGALESEPAWPEGEATTMIDADAESILVAPAAAGPSGPITDQIPATQADPPRRFGLKLFLILVGAAAVLTLVITLIAVAVHNGNDNGSTETVPATVLATSPATTPDTSPSTTSSTSTSTSTTTSTSVGTSTSLP
jgi:serine/threonine protein phosphatase PrpC